MSSPWGQVDHVTKYVRGVSFVSTPSHGGMRISRGFAERHLSDSALSRAIRMGGYYYWEEDCDYLIPLWELPEVCAMHDITRESMLSSLSSWNAGYLLERGITPSEPEYSNYLARKLDEKMRSEKHPNLITCAQGDWHARVPKDQVMVITADGMEYLVTKSSYDSRTTPNLLSNCEVLSGPC